MINLALIYDTELFSWNQSHWQVPKKLNFLLKCNSLVLESVKSWKSQHSESNTRVVPSYQQYSKNNKFNIIYIRHLWTPPPSLYETNHEDLCFKVTWVWVCLSKKKKQWETVIIETKVIVNIPDKRVWWVIEDVINHERWGESIKWSPEVADN